MHWYDDPDAVRVANETYRRENFAEYRRERWLRVLRWALVPVVICAAVFGLISLVRSNAPSTFVLRVTLATLHSRPEATLRYPGARVLRQEEDAGVSTLDAQYAVSGGGGRQPLVITPLGYSGPVNPARTAQLFTVHAGWAAVDAWYRRTLLAHGWCLVMRDTTLSLSREFAATRVQYLRGQELYQIEYGYSRLVTYEYLRELPGPQATPDMAAVMEGPQAIATMEADPRKVEQVLHSLEDSPKAPLTVYTSYERYPDGSTSVWNGCAAPAGTPVR